MTRDAMGTYVFSMSFQPRGNHSAIDGFEDSPQEWFEKERCTLWYHRAYRLDYEDRHQTPFRIVGY